MPHAHFLQHGAPHGAPRSADGETLQNAVALLATLEELVKLSLFELTVHLDAKRVENTEATPHPARCGLHRPSTRQPDVLTTPLYVQS